MGLSVCIFARNEEKHLARCIIALEAAGLNYDDQVHILVNGCTDATAQIAATLACADKRIEVHHLPVGDKANAWNEYVHRISTTEINTHIFLDGDIRPSTASLSELDRCFYLNRNAYGVAALPITGRSRRSWSKRLLCEQYISGNLYALSAAAILRFRSGGIYMPIGAKGEDGLLTYILLTDFKGGADDSFLHNIEICVNSTFEFDSLTFNIDDCKTYIKRLTRYSERHFQKTILYEKLKREGLAALPENIYDIYTPAAIATARPRLHPLDVIFDLNTIRLLRRRQSKKRRIYSRA
ncbi:glycosyltransferase [Hyphococcus flavus]|uniref:Glycosyltransferase n=1 Tax=Hyphococcus flavus TaxID=1866326 RepID=A0AAF0CFK5_9PROT|nr:glycosyltransferase [Hyphococcus flavus]WDI31048.1 glycosyltransferase [Hyphococcus flavus]